MNRIAHWIAKHAPRFLTRGGDHSGSPGFIDLYKGQRAPTHRQLIDQYVETAYACANINASTVASTPIRLFRRLSREKQVTTKAERRSWKVVSRADKQWLGSQVQSKRALNGSLDFVEVTNHPLLDLLSNVNEHMDGFTLMELTTLYQETVGSAYWWLEIENGVPIKIWPLPSHEVTVLQKPDASIISGYEYGPEKQPIPVEEMIAFHYPNLRDPYAKGWSPIRAAAETQLILRLDNAFTQALMFNRSRPDILISPKDSMGDAERKRLERTFSKKFWGPRAGGVHVAQDGIDVKPLGYPPRDMEALARRKVSKISLCNAHGVPVALLEAESINRATLEGALVQHARYAIKPRCVRMFERLNQMLVPFFGEGLFLWFDDPVPLDRKLEAVIRKSDVAAMIRTPNEAREELHLEPQEWGEVPWVSKNLRRVDEEPSEPPQVLPPGIPPPKPDPEDPEGDIPKPKNEGKTPDPVLVFGLLNEYKAGLRSRAETIAKLTWFGVDFPKAFDWTEKSAVTSDAPSEREERDAPFTRPGWHLQDCKASGHDRSLPRGNKLKAILVTTFAGQRKEVLLLLGAKLVSDTAMVKAPRSLFKEINLSGWNKKLAAEAFPVLEIYWDEGGSQAVERYGAGTDAVFRVTDPATKKAIREASFDFAESTNANTSLRLNKALDRLSERFIEVGVEGSNLPVLLSKAVNEIFDGLTKHHSETIALTESSRAVHAAQRMSAERSGVVKGYKWLLSGDACPICVEIANKYKKGIKLDGNFGEQKGDGNPTYKVIQHPPAHPRCMCTITEILDLGDGVETADEDDSVVPSGEKPRPT